MSTRSTDRGVWVPRLSRLFKLMEDANLDAIVLVGQPNITYFTGVSRPEGSVIIALGSGCVELLTPVLEFYRVQELVSGLGLEVVPYSRYDVEFDVPVVRDLVGYLKGKLGGLARVGLDLNYINYSAYQLVRSLGIEVVDLSRDILEMRAVKEDREVELITKALRIAEEAFVKALDELKPKVSESMFAGIIEMYVRRSGADGLAFNTIVASGRNSSYPHAVPTGKELGYGEPVIVDLGTVYMNYCSDMTRTVYVGDPPSGVVKMLEAVAEALAAAEDHVAPYARVSEVDALVRRILGKHRLSKHFVHSTGHGVGVEVHELPRIASGVDEVLKPGMVVTLEPGVYIRGLYGVRIEDMVLVTGSGRVLLNTLPRIVA